MKITNAWCSKEKQKKTQNMKATNAWCSKEKEIKKT
jgi:hypothetical protein